MTRPNLSVQVGSIRLRNPVLTASGTFGYGLEMPHVSRRLGGIVTKTITLEPRSGNPPPRIVETPSGVLNSIGLQNVGVDRFIGEKLPGLRDLGVPIVVSVGGRQVSEYEAVLERLEPADSVAAYEINISCPNVREGGLEFSCDRSAAASLVRAVRKRTSRPLWVKLSPNVTSIGKLAKVCEEEGADAVTAINTFVGMAVDIRSRKARLPAGKGGLSGPAIRPLALARVREVVESVSIPVIGVGGILNGRDAMEFLLVGAHAIQVGTASFVRPDRGVQIVEEIATLLEELGVSSVEEYVGTLEGGPS